MDIACRPQSRGYDFPWQISMLYSSSVPNERVGFIVSSRCWAKGYNHLNFDFSTANDLNSLKNTLPKLSGSPMLGIVVRTTTLRPQVPTSNAKASLADLVRRLVPHLSSPSHLTRPTGLSPSKAKRSCRCQGASATSRSQCGEFYRL